MISVEHWHKGIRKGGFCYINGFCLNVVPGFVRNVLKKPKKAPRKLKHPGRYDPNRGVSPRYRPKLESLNSLIKKSKGKGSRKRN